MLIYKNYDKAALDLQYNNRAQVSDFEQIVQGWQERSEAIRQQAPLHEGLAYGSHPREYVDIFPGGQSGSAVQLFFHGGYWQSMETRVFHFIAAGFTRHNITTVFVNYPLAPAAMMDEIVDACRRAMVWLYDHVGAYGGDPDKIYISGHSAGGHLVAMLMATVWPALSERLPGDLIKGGCAISGLFDLVPIQLSYVNDNIGMDQVTAKRNSPILMSPATGRPLIVAVGGLETDEYHAQSHEFAAAWSDTGPAVTELTAAGCNHFTVLEPLIDGGAELNRAVLAQMGLLKGTA